MKWSPFSPTSTLVMPSAAKSGWTEEKNRMVNLIVTIDAELLRRMDTAVHPDLAAEGITRVEVGEKGLHFIRNNDPGLI